jgi:hypothetical protein
MATSITGTTAAYAAARPQSTSQRTQVRKDAALHWGLPALAAAILVCTAFLWADNALGAAANARESIMNQAQELLYKVQNPAAWGLPRPVG